MGIVPKPDLDKIQRCTDEIRKLLHEIDEYVEEYEESNCLTLDEAKRLRKKISSLTSKLTKYFKPAFDLYKHAERYEDYIKGRVFVEELNVGSASRADKAYRIDATYVEANEIFGICESLSRTLNIRVSQYNKTLDSISSEFKDIGATERAIASHNEKSD